LWARLAEVGSDRLRQALQQHRAIVERNLNLVRLKSDLPLPSEWQTDWPAVQPDPAGLRKFYERLGLRSFLKDLFVTPALF